MNLELLYNPVALCLLLSVFPIGALLSNVHLQSTLRVARDLSIPVGFTGTLFSALIMLQDLADPSTIGPSLAESKTYLLYGLIQALVLTALLRRLKATDTTPPAASISKLLGSLALLFCGVLLPFFALESTNLLMLINPSAMVFVLLGTYLLLNLAKTPLDQLASSLAQYGILTALAAIFISTIELLGNMDDPTRIGPPLASGFSSLFYGALLVSAGIIIQQARTQSSLPLLTPLHLSSSLLFVIYLGFCDSYMLNQIKLETQLWELQNQQELLKQNVTRQNGLLRELVPSLVTTEKTSRGPEEQEATKDSSLGSLTISSDLPAYIFIDGKLVQQTPLFKYKLTAGTHEVKIASCPNTTPIMLKDEVTWLQYWQEASDGTCNYPENPEDWAYITTNIHQEGEYEIHERAYDPAVNYCCDDQTTKTITVDITGDDLLYFWSFEQQKWR